MSYWYPQCGVKLTILPEDFQLKSDATKETTFEIDVQARNVMIHVNDYKSADTFTMDIDYKNFPFDPRSVRYCGVTIYMQDMGGIFNRDGSVNKIVPGKSTKIDPTITNIVFMGFVDDEEIEFNDSKRTVKFTGRDFTSLLIDQKYVDEITNRTAPIFPTQTIDVSIKSLISAFKATRNIGVVVDPSVPLPLPILSSYASDFGAPLAGGRNVGSRETYWDIIQKLVGEAGLIAYMGLQSKAEETGLVTKPAIILTTPRNQALTSEDDIKFIYGKNIKNLSMKRKLGRLKGFNIRVICRVEKEVLSATVPEEATPEWCLKYGIPRERVLVPVVKPDGSLDQTTTQPAPTFAFPVPSGKVTDKDALIQIAQKTFEQYSLQQLEGSFDTFEMLGRGTSRLNDAASSLKQFDLTHIKKHQTIQIEIDTDDLSKISRMSSIPERIQYLVLRNYPVRIATIFASTMGKFSPRFLIKSYAMSIDQEQGWKLHVDFYNIVDTNQKGLS